MAGDRWRSRRLLGDCLAGSTTRLYRASMYTVTERDVTPHMTSRDYHVSTHYRMYLPEFLRTKFYHNSNGLESNSGLPSTIPLH
eukprot:428518-Amorphochlora_amoeboformis.AAC.1